MNEVHRNETILSLSHYLIKLHRKRCQKTQQKVCEKKANMTEELCRVFSKPTVLGRPKSNFKSSKETWHWQILQALTETSGGIYISVEANQRQTKPQTSIKLIQDRIGFKRYVSFWPVRGLGKSSLKFFTHKISSETEIFLEY